MSSDKNPEVVGCDASIMRNVWEIREREYDQKMQLEQERQERSALASINQDWANRLAARQGTYKRVEKKVKPAEPPADDSSVWKSKQPQARPPPAPRGPGPTPNKRAPQQKGFSAQVKDKKGQDKGFDKLNLLKYITTAQPSAMVWGKSWKFNKCLPKEEEGAENGSFWGQSWMFATHQPYSEEGQPWPNGPCKINPVMLHLWNKPPSRAVEHEELGWSPCSDEWDMSWKKANKENQDSSSGQEASKFGFFASLIESQHHNNNLYTSEWSDSWMSTKPSDNECPTVVSNMEAADGDEMLSSEWVECWKMSNHHGLSKTPEVRQSKSHNPEWVNSWRAAMMVQNNNKSESYVNEAYAQDHNKRKELMFVSNRNKYRSLYLDIDKEVKAISEWSESWQVAKNNAKPSAEIEKTLKTEPPKMEGPLKVQRKPKLDSSGEDSKFTQLKKVVLFLPKRDITHSMLSHLKRLEKAVTGSEWRDSWKMLKHRLRTERQRMRLDRLRPLEETGRVNTSEWKDSWKCTNHLLGQNPEMWQQQWTTTPQIRINRAREYNHFAPVELPKNGPTGERSWTESWRLSRHQQETSQRGLTSASNRPVTTQLPHRQEMRSVGDWQEAWMVSETQYRHDKPSYTQWVDAWRGSAFLSGGHQWNEQTTGKQWMDASLEIKHQKEILSTHRANTKMSRSFEKNIFLERYPEKQWHDSWKVGSLLKDCASEGEATQTTSNEYGSKWGMSFRLANPMPEMNQSWVKTSPNLCYYEIIWPRRKIIQTYMNTDFTSNPRIFKLWASSQQFLQSFSVKLTCKSKPMESVDPQEIIGRKINIKKHLYSNLEKKEKQPDKKWAGCHLLGKTQPRPKKGGPVKKVNLEMESADMFFEEWAESWRFLVRSNRLKTQAVKSLRGWEEAWKFLFPPYQTLNGPRAK